MARTAMVVDDSATIRNIVKVTLQEHGFETLTAQDGVKALKLAESRALDIIVTDINMPNMDGIELIRELRNTPSHKFTPILVVTTEGGDNTKDAGKKAGASGWIVKPLKPETLIRAVTKLCGE